MIGIEVASSSALVAANRAQALVVRRYSGVEVRGEVHVLIPVKASELVDWMVFGGRLLNHRQGKITLPTQSLIFTLSE